MTKHVLLINDDGTATVGGVTVRVVPLEPTSAMLVDAVKERHGQATYRCVSASGCVEFEAEARADYEAMLSAAAIDLSSLPVVPERLKSPPFGWLPDDGGEEYAQAYNAALDAMGVK